MDVVVAMMSVSQKKKLYVVNMDFLVIAGVCNKAQF